MIIGQKDIEIFALQKHVKALLAELESLAKVTATTSPPND
jgi:hypothetical protein